MLQTDRQQTYLPPGVQVHIPYWKMVARMLSGLVFVALCTGAGATACMAGKYGNGDTCTACAVGKYGDVKRPTAQESHCQDCGTGRYSDAVGMAACLPCQPCSVGTFRQACGAPIDPTSSGNCVSCAGGTYKPLNTEGSDEDGTPILTSCLNCPAGKFSNPGQQRCQDCAGGHYAPEEAVGTCIACEMRN